MAAGEEVLLPGEPGGRLSRDTSMDDTEGAVADLYRRTCPQLVGLLTSIGGNRSDAEEVAQDAFVALLRNWETVSGYADPAGWVRGAAVRALISRRRRDAVARRGMLRLAARGGYAVAHPGAGAVDLERALSSLSVEHRAVLFLHHVLDLPVHEVAAELGTPVGTVKSRLARARAAVAPLLHETEGTRDHA